MIKPISIEPALQGCRSAGVPTQAQVLVIVVLLGAGDEALLPPHGA